MPWPPLMPGWAGIRFPFGLLGVLVVCGAATACADQPGIGDRVSVGDLDLTVLGYEWYDSSQHSNFNTENLRVAVVAHNARGSSSGTYTISSSYFSLVDGNGVVHGGSWVCEQCPYAILRVDMVRGGRIRGYVYFEFAGPPVELIYEPAFSFNKTRICLSAAC